MRFCWFSTAVPLLPILVFLAICRIITIENGTIQYVVICVDYTMIDNNGEIYGYAGNNTTVRLVFGEDKTWFSEDESFVDRFTVAAAED